MLRTAGRRRGPEKMSRAALLGLAVHAYCLRPRALPWPFFRSAGPGEPSFEARAGSCSGCLFTVEERQLSPHSGRMPLHAGDPVFKFFRQIWRIGQSRLYSNLIIVFEFMHDNRDRA